MSQATLQLLYHENESAYHINLIYRFLRRFLTEDQIILSNGNKKTLAQQTLVVIGKEWKNNTNRNRDTSKSDSFLESYIQALQSDKPIAIIYLHCNKINWKTLPSFQNENKPLLERIEATVTAEIWHEDIAFSTQNIIDYFQLNILPFAKQKLSLNELENEEKRLQIAFNAANTLRLNEKKQRALQLEKEQEWEAKIIDLQNKLKNNKTSSGEINTLKKELAEAEQKLSNIAGEIKASLKESIKPASKEVKVNWKSKHQELQKKYDKLQLSISAQKTISSKTTPPSKKALQETSINTTPPYYKTLFWIMCIIAIVSFFIGKYS